MLQSEASFDAAHFLKGYDGKCKNIHGHRWRIVVRISGDSLIASGPKKGMLIDFGDLKSALTTLADRFDHALLVEEGTLKEKTMEALREEDFRRYFFQQLTEMGLTPQEVAVYETPNNCAVYTGGKEAPQIVQL